MSETTAEPTAIAVSADADPADGPAGVRSAEAATGRVRRR